MISGFGWVGILCENDDSCAWGDFYGVHTSTRSMWGRHKITKTGV